MTEFAEDLRHRCRHKNCRTKLREPEPNHHRAFCKRGCYDGFFSRRCLVCERELPAESRSDRKLCKRSKCRSAYRQNPGKFTFGYLPSESAHLAQKVPDFIDSKPAVGSDRPWLPKRLTEPWQDKPGWRWQRMLTSDGSEREDNDWQLLNREGRIVARVRQEGAGYWMARPRMIPEPPVESFEDVCRRAVSAAMATLPPWPETERHPVHPGMTPSQYQATRRDLRRKYPDWSSAQVDRFIEQTLKPNAKAQTIFKRDTPPINVLGGYKFPDAPAVELRGPSGSNDLPTMTAEISRSDWRPVSPAQPVADDLSIPDFLKREPAAASESPDGILEAAE
jgi:hypothetical protein